MGMNLTTPLIAPLQVQYYERLLQRESVVEDIFTALKGVYQPTLGREVPNVTMFDLIQNVPKGTRNARVPLQQNLSGAPQEGTAVNPVGLEEILLQKYADFHFNDISHVDALQQYGIEAETYSYYDVFEQITPLEAIYWKEQEGKYIREAYLESVSQNLTLAPTLLAQVFNPNWAVCGDADGNWPVWNQVAAVWTNNIGARINAAGTGAAAACTLRFLQAVEERITSGIVGNRNQIIEPVMIGGSERYVCVLPSPQYRWMTDAIQANGLGTVYRDVQGQNDKYFSYPNSITEVGKLWVVSDPRYPTLTLAGSAPNFTLTPAYRLPGNVAASDPRDKSATAIEIGYILGKAGLCKWMPEPYHWEWQFERYDKFAGKGIFASAGWEMVWYDYAAANWTANTRYQNSSLVMSFRHPPAVT
jgi:hypothetical protein